MILLETTRSHPLSMTPHGTVESAPGGTAAISELVRAALSRSRQRSKREISPNRVLTLLVPACFHAESAWLAALFLAASTVVRVITFCASTHGIESVLAPRAVWAYALVDRLSVNSAC